MIPTEAVRRVRRTDPGTSFEAAVMADGLARSQQYAVLTALIEAKRPLGAEEIADAAGMEAYTARKRLPELKTQGLVDLAPGERATRSGRTERLWQLTQGATQ